MPSNAKSLEAEIAERRAELTAVTRELAATRETAQTLLGHAQAILANAKADTEAIVTEATALAETIIGDARTRVAKPTKCTHPTRQLRRHFDVQADSVGRTIELPDNADHLRLHGYGAFKGGALVLEGSRNGTDFEPITEPLTEPGAAVAQKWRRYVRPRLVGGDFASLHVRLLAQLP